MLPPLVVRPPLPVARALCCAVMVVWASVLAVVLVVLVIAFAEDKAARGRL